MEQLQMINRKDGIIYTRRCKNSNEYNKCICVRLNNNVYENLKEFGKPGTILRELAIDFLKKENRKRNLK